MRESDADWSEFRERLTAPPPEGDDSPALDRPRRIRASYLARSVVRDGTAVIFCLGAVMALVPFFKALDSPATGGDQGGATFQAGLLEGSTVLLVGSVVAQILFPPPPRYPRHGRAR